MKMDFKLKVDQVSFGAAANLISQIPQSSNQNYQNMVEKLSDLKLNQYYLPDFSITNIANSPQLPSRSSVLNYNQKPFGQTFSIEIQSLTQKSQKSIGTIRGQTIILIIKSKYQLNKIKNLKSTIQVLIYNSQMMTHLNVYYFLIQNHQLFVGIKLNLFIKINKKKMIINKILTHSCQMTSHKMLACIKLYLENGN